MGIWCECVYVPWLYLLGKLRNHKSVEGRTAAEDRLSYVFRLLLTTGEFHCENILSFLVSTCGTSVMISHDSSLSIPAIWYNRVLFLGSDRKGFQSVQWPEFLVEPSNL